MSCVMYATEQVILQKPRVGRHIAAVLLLLLLLLMKRLRVTLL